MNYRALL